MVSEEDTGTQLFHSSRVHTAKAFEAEIQVKTAVEKAEKEAKKIQGAENKRRKEQEAQEKVLQRQVVRDAKAVEVAEKQAVKEAKKKQLELVKKGREKSSVIILQSEKPLELSTKVIRFGQEVDEIKKEKVPISVKTKTREIRLPERYKT